MLAISPSASEINATVAGDELVPDAQVTMNRGFDLPGSPENVWPWLAQLGKGRAGWYLPRRIEYMLPVRRRALRHIEPTLQHLQAGDTIADWGGRNATFEIVTHEPPNALVHWSRRGNARISWTILLRPVGTRLTRVHLRFRIAGVRRVWLLRTGGELLDWTTIALLAHGLRERVREST